MRTILERYLERVNETGELVYPNSPAYDKALEVAGIGGKENHLTYKYVLQEMRLVRGLNPHYVLLLTGGKNGNGKWDEYLHVQVRLIQSAVKRFGDAWVCQLENDCLDDVHTLIVGFRYNKELTVRVLKDDQKVPPLRAQAEAPIPAYANEAYAGA